MHRIHVVAINIPRTAFLYRIFSRKLDKQRSIESEKRYDPGEFTERANIEETLHVHTYIEHA